MNYVLYGEEYHRIQESIKQIVKQHVQEDLDLNVTTYDAMHTSLQVILEDAMTVPFFSDYKVIIVTNANFLSATNNTNIDIKELEAYITQPFDSTILILTGEFAKLDMRKKAVKKMKAEWKVLEYRKLDEIGKQSYVKDEIKRRNISMNAVALTSLIKRLPFDMGIILHEMDKLELFGEVITKDIVEKLVNRPLEEDVFMLVNAVVEKDLQKALFIWQDLRVTNTDPIYLIALLSQQFRFLFQVKSLMEKGQRKETIISTLSAHPYRVKITMDAVQSIPVSYLLEMLAKLAELDQKIKGGLIDKILGFELFLIETTRSIL